MRFVPFFPPPPTLPFVSRQKENVPECREIFLRKIAFLYVFFFESVGRPSDDIIEPYEPVNGGRYRADGDRGHVGGPVQVIDVRFPVRPVAVHETGQVTERDRDRRAPVQPVPAGPVGGRAIPEHPGGPSGERADFRMSFLPGRSVFARKL